MGQAAKDQYLLMTIALGKVEAKLRGTHRTNVITVMYCSTRVSRIDRMLA